MSISAQVFLSDVASMLEKQRIALIPQDSASYLDENLGFPGALSATAIQELHGKACTDCVVVMNYDRQVLGILTTQDLMQLGADSVPFWHTQVKDVVKTPALVLREEYLTDLATTYDFLRYHRASYVPVVGQDGALTGLLSDECLRQALIFQRFSSAQPGDGTLGMEQLTEVLEILAARENALSKIIGQIYSSSDLPAILDTTVTEMRRLLGCDRVIIYELRPDLSGVVVAESIIEGGRSLLYSEAHDPCIVPEWLEPYRQGRVRIVSDIREAAMSMCHQELLTGLDIRAKLMVPIVVNEKLWGLMISSYQDVPRQWKADEISWSRQLAKHTAIAIQQTFAYEEAQEELKRRQEAEAELAALNQDLEDKVRERTVELQEQQQFMQTVFDTVPMPIFWKDRQSVFVGGNKASAEQLGLESPEAMIGKTDFDFSATEKMAANYQSDDRAVMESGQPKLGIIENIQTPDDKTLYIETNKAPLRNLEGDVMGLVGIFQNITERKESEQAIARQLAAIEASVEGIGILKDCRFLYVNRAHLKLFGYEDPSELVGSSYTKLYSPEENERLSRDMMSSLNTTGLWQGEAIATKKDGSTFLQEFSVTRLEKGLIICVCRDITQRKQSEDKLRILLNKTQLLHEVSFAIRASLDLDTILRNTVEALFEKVDADICAFGWYEYGASRKAWSVVVESKVSEIPTWIGDYVLNPYESLLEAIAAAEIYQCQSIDTVIEGNENDDQLPRSFFDDLGISNYLCVPIRTYGGRIGLLHLGRIADTNSWDSESINLLEEVGVQVAIAINQSQLYKESQGKTQEIERSYEKLKETQLQLVQAEKMSGLGQLVAGIAHEINNPVSFIYGNLSPASAYFETLTKLLRLYEVYHPDTAGEIDAFIKENDVEYLMEDFPKLVQSMRNGASRIQTIVQSLRVFSRLDESSRKRINLHDSIDNILTIVASRLDGSTGTHKIRLIKQYDENLPAVECLAGPLNQVFMNLISNAADAVNDRQKGSSASNFEGEITIKTESAPNDRVCITVQDNGTGIEEEIKAKIFDPFFTTKPVGVGTGMGLAISYQIVTGNHDGNLSCDSTPGEGAVFTVDLPITMQQ
ncbi:MAG: GAF domain-containing protein [Cyanobacteria bacterium P01_C01_bin.89]